MAGKYAIETVFNLVDKITRPMSNIDKQAKIVNRTLKNMYTGAEKATDRFTGKLKSVGGKLAGALGLAGILNIDKIAGFLTKDITNAIEYQTALAKVGTIADVTAVPLGKLSDQILALSTKMGVGTNEIAESTYQAISAGVSTEKALSVVEAATKAGIAGFTDTATAIDGLTSVLNAYGLSAEKVTAISDQMLIAQNLGKTSFGQMSSTMGQIIPTAAALKVSTGELFASIASLTSNAIPTSQAMTGLKAALSNVMKPSSNAAEMAKKLGIQFNAAALQGKGLAAFLDDIAKATGGNQAILAQLFGSTEAVNAINVLIGSGSELFGRALQDMQDAAGATEEAFNKMMNTPEKRWAKVTNTIRNAGINLGNSLLPIVERVIEKIGGIADSIAKIDFSQYTGSFEKAFRVIEFFASALFGAIKLAWQFRGVIFAALGVLGAYYLLSMLVVGAAKLYTTWEGIKSAAIFTATFLTGEQTAALALLKAGTLKYLFVEKIFAIATAIRSVLLGILTKGTLLQSAATAKMAVATGTATIAQWLLNAAMSANPVGLVVIAIAVLVGIIAALVKWGHKAAAVFITIAGVLLGPLAVAVGFIISAFVELIKGWGSVTKAFKDGGILAGLKQIAALLLSGLLGPIQGLLELLAKIPGVDKLLEPAVKGLNDFRNKLKGIEGPIIEPEVKTPESEFDRLIKEFGITMPEMDIPGLDMPDFDISSPVLGDKSNLHGVVDISGGAIPGIDGGGTYTATGAVNSASPPTTETLITRTAVEIAAVLRRIDAGVSLISRSLPTPTLPPIPAPETVVSNVINIPPLADRGVYTNTYTFNAASPPAGETLITRTAVEIAAILRRIDAGVFLISHSLPISARLELSEISAPATATRTSPITPRVRMGGDEGAADYYNPRNIAPVTQAERMAYSFSERKETVVIEVAAEKGTAARIVRAPRDVDIRLVASGGNA